MLHEICPYERIKGEIKLREDGLPTNVLQGPWKKVPVPSIEELCFIQASKKKEGMLDPDSYWREQAELLINEEAFGMF